LVVEGIGVGGTLIVFEATVTGLVVFDGAKGFT
jgi:hypothetical protein